MEITPVIKRTLVIGGVVLALLLGLRACMLPSGGGAERPRGVQR